MSDQVLEPDELIDDLDQGDDWQEDRPAVVRVLVEQANEHAGPRSPWGGSPALRDLQARLEVNTVRWCGSEWLDQQERGGVGRRAVPVGCHDRVYCYRCASSYRDDLVRENLDVALAMLERGPGSGGVTVELTVPAVLSVALDRLRVEDPDRWEKVLDALFPAAAETVKRLWWRKAGRWFYELPAADRRRPGRVEVSDVGFYLVLHVNSSGRPGVPRYHFHALVFPLDAAGQPITYFWPASRFGGPDGIAAGLRQEWAARAGGAAAAYLDYMPLQPASNVDGSAERPAEWVVHVHYLPPERRALVHRLRYDLRGLVHDLADHLESADRPGCYVYVHRHASGKVTSWPCTASQLARGFERETAARGVRRLRYYGFMSPNKRPVVFPALGLERVSDDDEGGRWETVGRLQLAGVRDSGLVFLPMLENPGRFGVDRWTVNRAARPVVRRWDQLNWSTPAGKRARWRRSGGA